MRRFDLNANTISDAINYVKNRALQIAHTGAVLKNITKIPEGIWGHFIYEDESFYALYVLEKYRGHGMFYTLWNEKCREHDYKIKIITTTACSLAPYLRHKEIPFLLVNGLTNTPEYNLIENVYGNTKTKRTGVFYMNHIDEGLYILNKINASYYAKLGYILHPVFQGDQDIKDIYNHADIVKVSHQAIINAVEYRSVANEYLSQRNVRDIGDIRLSPLKDVNHMLIADKIQNRKDFEIYHKGKHERSKQLTKYFNNWMQRLDITEKFYEETVNELDLLSSRVIA